MFKNKDLVVLSFDQNLKIPVLTDKKLFKLDNNE